jgi:putative ABC transport system permease protein
MRDIRVTLRALVAQPGLTATVALTPAVALGASGAVFSVVHAVLLRPLPFAAPERVVVLGEFSPASATTFVAPVTFDDWRTRQSVFDEIAAFRYWETVNFEDGASEPESVTLATGSENLFRAVGIRPLIGRTYREEQRREGGSEAVISHELRKRRYASDPAVLGRVVRIRGTPTTIVGVMPPMPTTLSIGWGDLWTCLYRYDVPQMRATKYRARYLTVVGRLPADVSLDQATTKMQALQRQLWTEPTSVAGFDVHLQPLSDVLTGGVRLPLLVVSGAVVLLLLVACANVVTLISVRAASRGREIVTRLALGAEPLHVLRLMALEGFMLALAGGAGGLAVTWVGLRGLSAIGSAIPRFNDAAVGVEVVAFSIVLALAIAVLCSIVPVLQVGRGNVAATLAESGRSGTDGPQTERLRQGLVVLQIALACLLLTSGSLLLRSFANVLRVNPGFVSRRAVYFDLYLPDSRYPDAAAYTRFYRELVRRFEVEPATEAAGALLYFPYKPKLWPVSVEVQGAPVPAGEEPIVYFNQIAGDYFRAMDIPLVSGRLPTEREIWDRSASPAIVINKTMARQLFGDSNAIGRRIRSGPTAAWNEIIGVVGDVRQQRLDIRRQRSTTRRFNRCRCRSSRWLSERSGIVPCRLATCAP